MRPYYKEKRQRTAKALMTILIIQYEFVNVLQLSFHTVESVPCLPLLMLVELYEPGSVGRDLRLGVRGGRD